MSTYADMASSKARQACCSTCAPTARRPGMDQGWSYCMTNGWQEAIYVPDARRLSSLAIPARTSSTIVQPSSAANSRS